MTASEYAGFKRVMECYQADPSVRRSLENGEEDILYPLGLSGKQALVRDGIRRILSGDFTSRKARQNPYVREYADRNNRVSEVLQKRTAKENFAADGIWQYSNVVRNRCRMENRMIRMHSNIYYYPVCFELSQGCRVQCPFCGLKAEVWSRDFRYTQENRSLWREILQITKELLGSVVNTCPCYFATEPLDNPDYEKFLKDVWEITGDVPQTTTALAEKLPDRTRNLMKFLGEEQLKEKNALRFSVRILKQFYRLMELYTPEELENVELVINNPESTGKYSNSGRAAENRQESQEKLACYSISCVAGIRVNMAAGTMAFTEPEQPCKQYPLGMRTREVLSFRDADSYRNCLIRLFRSYAFGTIPHYVPVQINRNVQVRNVNTENGKEIWLIGDQTGYRVTAHPLIESILKQLKNGCVPAQLFQKCNLSVQAEQKIYSLLNELYIRGYLCQK